MIGCWKENNRWKGNLKILDHRGNLFVIEEFLIFRYNCIEEIITLTIEYDLENLDKNLDNVSTMAR